MNRVIIAATLATLTIGSGLAGVRPVGAHDGATGVVKERMEVMKSFGKGVKELSHMFKGEADYDAATVTATATAIERHSGAAITRLFPQGSAGHPSEASEAIWSDWAVFETEAADLGRKAAGLAAAAGGGVETAKPAFAAMAGTCKSCHHDFKED